MLVFLFSLTFSLMFGNTQPPNYYPNYAAAREASKKMQKELVVFFTDNSSNACESAWSAFTNDANVSSLYVCTRLDIKDFDGGVFFEHFAFRQTPAWVILTPEADVKEKWEGVWKNSNGSTISKDKSIAQPNSKEEKNPISQTNNGSIPSQSSISSPTGVDKSIQSQPTPVSELKPTTTQSQPIKISTGFAIQAGFFGSEINAQKMISDLKVKGFNSFKIELLQKEGKTFYRVVSGEYDSESDMNKVQQQLSKAGIQTSVKK